MDPTVGAGRAAGVGEDTAGGPRGAGVGSEVGCDIGVGTSAVPPALAGVVGTGPVSVGAEVVENASVAEGRAGLAVGIESSSDPQATSAAVVRAATKTNSASLGNVRNRTGEISRRSTSLILSTLPASSMANDCPMAHPTQRLNGTGSHPTTVGSAQPPVLLASRVIAAAQRSQQPNYECEDRRRFM